MVDEREMHAKALEDDVLRLPASVTHDYAELRRIAGEVAYMTGRTDLLDAIADLKRTRDEVDRLHSVNASLHRNLQDCLDSDANQELKQAAQAHLRTLRLLSDVTAERDAMREIVAFVAGCPQGPDDYVMLAISKAMSNKARALMAGGE